MTLQSLSRRKFLSSAAAAGSLGVAGKVASVLAQPIPLAQEQSRFVRPTSPAEFRLALVGPIQSQPTPIAANLDVDYDGIRNIVRRGLRYGVKIFELTAGNSQYFALSYDEIKRVTRTLVEAVEARGITIAATSSWWTDRAVDYARYAESVGADAVQVLLPTPAGGEDAIVRHFEAIAGGTRLPIVLHGVYSESLMTKLLHIESIVAMKEDSALDYYIDRMIQFGDRLEIFSGGAESRYLVGYPYGAKSFFSTYTSFAPDISMQFWAAIQQGDIRKAADITKRYDYPFIKRFTVPWWHATLEYFGVARRFVRPPQVAYTDEQMKDVKRFFDGQGIDPAKYRT
jgi:dihydrodipicolinate synthase/N-acetylneuraminate lyase